MDSTRTTVGARSACWPTTSPCSALLEPTELRLYKKRLGHRDVRPGRGLPAGRARGACSCSSRRPSPPTTSTRPDLEEKLRSAEEAAEKADEDSEERRRGRARQEALGSVPEDHRRELRNGHSRGTAGRDRGVRSSRSFAIAADIEHAPVWQGSLKDVEMLFLRDSEGRAGTVETESDAKVKTVKARLKFSLRRARPRSRGTQLKGDVKALVRLVDAGGPRREPHARDLRPRRRPRVGCSACCCGGPVESQVRDFLLGGAAEGLKKQAEKG